MATKRLDENIGTVDYDKLFVSNVPVADVVTVKLTASQGVVKRGTVISGTPGGSDFAPLAKAATAAVALYVLADDIDTANETVGFAYRTGHFNRGALIVGSSYTLSAADEEFMRKYSPYLCQEVLLMLSRYQYLARDKIVPEKNLVKFRSNLDKLCEKSIGLLLKYKPIKWGNKMVSLNNLQESRPYNRDYDEEDC